MKLNVGEKVKAFWRDTLGPTGRLVVYLFVGGVIAFSIYSWLA